jgi:hypothetical protein
MTPGRGTLKILDEDEAAVLDEDGRRNRLIAPIMRGCSDRSVDGATTAATPPAPDSYGN